METAQFGMSCLKAWRVQLMRFNHSQSQKKTAVNTGVAILINGHAMTEQLTTFFFPFSWYIQSVSIQ